MPGFIYSVRSRCGALGSARQTGQVSVCRARLEQRSGSASGSFVNDAGRWQGRSFLCRRQRPRFPRTWFVATDSSQETDMSPMPKRSMLCVELRALLSIADNKAQPDTEGEEQSMLEKSLNDLFERLRVHVAATKQQILLVYFFEGTYSEARALLERFPTAAEPDILCTLYGAEIYQRGYLAPDPYWEQRMAAVGLGLDPKPIAWIMRESFGQWLEPQFEEKALTRRKSVVDMTFREVAYLEYAWKEEADTRIDRTRVIESIQSKLLEMGFSSMRCATSPVSGNLLLIPAKASISRSVQFIMNMVKLTREDVVLIGSESSPLIQDALQIFESTHPMELLEDLAPELLQSRSPEAKRAATGPDEGKQSGSGTVILLPSSSSVPVLDMGTSKGFQLVKASRAGAAGVTEALLSLGKL